MIDLLPKALVKLVVDYFNDDTYPIIVSTHSWTLKYEPRIAVDSVRLYVIADAEGIKGLSHSLANIKENERPLIELGNPQWTKYLWSGSSHDGRYVSFRHSYKTSIDRGEQLEDGTKWLTQSDEPEGRRPKRVTFDGEYLSYGLLSRDGQILCPNNYEGDDPTARVYQVTEEAEKDLVGFTKFELRDVVLVVSGKGNLVMVARPRKLEVHDISKEASKLVCQIDRTDFMCACALNEDGSEAAFVTYEGELRIMNVDKVVEDKIDQPAIVTVARSTESIDRLVYDNGGKLHVLHAGGKVSLFDPSTRELILLEAPQEGQKMIRSAISPNADYIAVLIGIGEADKYEVFEKWQTIVKRKLKDHDWADLFGYKAHKDKEAAKRP